MNPLTEVFGDTPDVAPYISTILGDEQLKSLTENLAAFPKIEELGGKYYDYMLGLMDRSIPGFADILSMGGDLTKKMQGIAAEELAGKIPQDVVDQVTRSTAFQNLMSGAGGSPMGTANQARNLGLTSLDMISKGVGLQEAAGNAAQRWAQIASGLNMNPASFFVTPQEQAAMTMQNNLFRQQTQQLRNNLAAAPNPVAKGVSDTIINLLGAYLGGLGGGKGGSGGTAPNAWSATFGGSGPSGPGPSDVTTPGQYVSSGSGGAGPNTFNLGVSQPFGVPGNPSFYNTSAPDLWSSFQPMPGYNAFNFGNNPNPVPNELMYPTSI